jgi:flagellar M-ring protein FliF
MAETGKNFVQQSVQILKELPTSKKISFAITITMAVGGFVALFLWANRPDYQVLFTNLETADAGRITGELKERAIPFKLKEGGSAILVPDKEVYQLRLELASEGIPRGQNVGFEVFDEIPFGTTEFVQRMKYQQALQGELARTIMQFDSVDRARVHIVTSGDSLFAEPERPATASVVLRPHPGRTLDRRQLQGIIHLVACGVEGLKPENVTVVDMEGGLLSRGHEEGDIGSLSKAQFDYQRKMESSLESRIQTMLEPVVGLNKAVVRVSAELDFSQVNISEEKFDPDSLVVRSEQQQEETSSFGRSLPAGSPDLKYQLYQSQGRTNASTKPYERKSALINYEINKVNKRINSSVGDIKRLSAAVVIDGPYVSKKSADGKEIKGFAPRSRKEMKNFEDIIKKAIGFRESRGDQVTVSNIPFAMKEGESSFSASSPGWIDYARKGFKPLFNIILVVLFFLFAIRPFRRWLNQAGEYVATKALQPGDEIPQLEPQAGRDPSTSGTKEKILDMNKTQPDLAAQVIRSWINERK